MPVFRDKHLPTCPMATTAPVAGMAWLAWLHNTGALARLKGRTQCVAMHLAYALPHGSGVLPNGQVVLSSGISLRTVRRSIGELEREGLIRVEEAVGVVPRLTLCKTGRGCCPEAPGPI